MVSNHRLPMYSIWKKSDLSGNHWRDEGMAETGDDYDEGDLQRRLGKQNIIQITITLNFRK